MDVKKNGYQRQNYQLHQKQHMSFAETVTAKIKQLMLFALNVMSP